MKTRKITGFFLVAVIVALIVYDIWAGMHGYDWTITSFIRETNHTDPVVPASIGLLFGYWLGRSGECAKSLHNIGFDVVERANQ
jgi:hypothetical protein